jgi:glycosyltransferase involved in cell wall biosynthesis
MRILWVSNAPHVGTGYGVQTRLFAPRLKELGHEVAIFGFYGEEGGLRDWNGIPIYPKNAHPYGQDAVPTWAAHFKADIVITLIDAWVYNPAEWKGVKWVPLYPVDTHPLDVGVGRAVSQAFARINFSKHGVAMTEQAGLDTLYCPHGVETEVYKPGDQQEARKRLGWMTDRFVYGMVAANKGFPARKSFPEVLLAFAELRRKHPETLLYLHSVPDERFGGFPLANYVNMLGLNDAVQFMNPNQATLGYPDAYMCDVYNAIDVLVSPSYGEGFGVPILEAQSCGTPVITGDWTAMSEITFAGWKIPQSQAQPFVTPHLSIQFKPDVEGVLACMDAAYLARNSEELAQKARSGALDYDADKITQQYWKPVLETLEKRISRAKSLEEVYQSAVIAPGQAPITPDEVISPPTLLLETCEEAEVAV